MSEQLTVKYYEAFVGELDGIGGNTPEQSAPEIPQDFKQWADVYADKIAGGSPRSIRDHIAAEIYSALIAAYRHLQSPPIPSLGWVKGRLPTERDLYICEIHIRNNGNHSVSVRYLEYIKGFDHFLGLRDGEWVERWILEEESLLPVQPDPSAQRCSDCVHLQVDNSPDQTGPAIWCGKSHFDGIGSKEEQDDLDKENDCSDFKRNAKRGQPSIEPDAPMPDHFSNAVNKALDIIYAERLNFQFGHEDARIRNVLDELRNQIRCIKHPNPVTK